MSSRHNSLPRLPGSGTNFWNDLDYVYLDVKYKESGNVTIATVTYSPVGDRPISVRGKARRLPQDYPSKDVGQGIALGRALMELGNQIQLRWDRRSQTNVGVLNKRHKLVQPDNGTVIQDNFEAWTASPALNSYPEDYSIPIKWPQKVQRPQERKKKA